MFAASCGALRWGAGRFLSGRFFPENGGVCAQRRLHASAGGGGGAKKKEEEAAVPKEALDNLLEEIQVVLSRPVPIGSLFRALSSTSKRTLVKNKEPLEQLLLRYPEHFAVYQQGNVRSRTIHCAPAHLVPANARRMFLEETSSAAAVSTNGASSSASPDASKGAQNINERVLQHDPLAERQRNISTVLQYIPNEWSPFTELGIPEEVRVKCMGKPAVKAFHYFEKHPQYFEVRQQGLGEHTFYVRRSLALQRNVEKTP